MLRERARARWVGAIVVVCSVAGARPARAETFSGPEFTALARQSIDLMRAQHYRIKGQLDRDVSDYFYEATVRYAPGMRFVNNDGVLADGGLERLGGGYWFGTGKPRTGVAFFSTAQLDAAIADGRSDHGFKDAMIFDGILMAGMSAKGFTLMGGARGGFTAGLDRSGRFALTQQAAATPDTERRTDFRFNGWVFNFEQAEGLSLGAVLGDAVSQDVAGAASRQRVLAAVRGLLQPESLMRRAGIRAFGAPAVGVDRIDGGIDYYGDIARRASGTNPSRAPLVEVPVLVDDLASVGIRVRAVTQVSPRPLFRLAELGYVRWTDGLHGGGRTVVFRSADRYVGSGEAFVGYTLTTTEKKGDGSSAPPVAATLSYSYNVPDTVTFFPVRDAHVIGLQFTVGSPLLARPIVPLVARTVPRTGDE